MKLYRAPNFQRFSRLNLNRFLSGCNAFKWKENISSHIVYRLTYAYRTEKKYGGFLCLSLIIMRFIFMFSLFFLNWRRCASQFAWVAFIYFLSLTKIMGFFCDIVWMNNIHFIMVRWCMVSLSSTSMRHPTMIATKWKRKRSQESERERYKKFVTYWTPTKWKFNRNTVANKNASVQPEPIIAKPSKAKPNTIYFKNTIFKWNRNFTFTHILFILLLFT